MLMRYQGMFTIAAAWAIVGPLAHAAEERSGGGCQVRGRPRPASDRHRAGAHEPSWPKWFCDIKSAITTNAQFWYIACARYVTERTRKTTVATAR